jgi:hypothetical protein
MPQHWQGKRFFFANIMASDRSRASSNCSPLGLSSNGKGSRHVLRVPRPRLSFRGESCVKALSVS